MGHKLTAILLQKPDLSWYYNFYVASGGADIYHINVHVTAQTKTEPIQQYIYNFK